jgi:hypothetical protein
VTLAQALLAPIFLHVLLTAIVGVMTGRARTRSVVSGQTKMRDIAVNNGAWPDDVLKIANNFNNQFQVPMLWYAACGLILVTGLADWIAVALSWAFFATRAAHSYIHTGSNLVRNRFRVFLAGFVIVICLWLWFALRLYVIG